jgi:hypothetical protein
MPVQPRGHARRLALTPGRQAALQVFEVSFAFHRFRMPP